MEKPETYTKYEKARMIGSRALQISMGAPFLAKLDKEELEKMKYDCLEIAKLEFEQGLIPFTVRRPLPRDEKEEKKAES